MNRFTDLFKRKNGICPDCEGHAAKATTVTSEGGLTSTEWKVCERCKGTGRLGEDEDFSI